MNVPKGPVRISGAAESTLGKATLKDRVLSNLNTNKEKGVTSGQIALVLGVGQSSVSSVLNTLVKHKQAHSKKLPGRKAYTYYPGEEGSDSPNIASINRAIKGITEQMQNMDNQVSQVKGVLKVVREYTLRLERMRDEKDEKLVEMEKSFKELEAEHLALMEKIEGLIK